MADYFPLVKGAVREYSIENAQGAGTDRIEILDVVTQGPSLTAKCRRATRRPGEKETVFEYSVTRDADGVRTGGYIELKHPLKVGTEWISPPRRYWIEALDAEAETPAGKFKGCIRVAYLIAEGDGGSGERYYAPDVGLVKIVENDEADPFTYSLVKLTA